MVCNCSNHYAHRGVYPMEMNGGSSVPPTMPTTPQLPGTPFTPTYPPSYHPIPPVFYTPPPPGSILMLPGVQTLPPYPVIPTGPLPGQVPHYTPQSPPQMVYPPGWIEWITQPIRYY